MASADYLLRAAIAAKRLVSFTLDGCRRIAEPHDYGIIDGAGRLFFYQVRGESRSGRPLGWRWGNLSKISGVQILDERFGGPRPAPSGQHIQWDVLIATVSPRPVARPRAGPSLGRRKDRPPREITSSRRQQREAAKGLEIHPLTPERWPALVQLFGPSGADGGCWCMYWRLRQREYTRSSRHQNQAALLKLVEGGHTPGLLAYQDRHAVGWCGLSPREHFARLERSRHFRSVDDQPTWSIVCFFVEGRYRRQHVASRLLQAAVAYSFEQGAQAVETYPIEAWSATVTAQSAFPGTVAWFHAAGFREVAKTAARSGGQARIIMRIERPAAPSASGGSVGASSA
jgi:GNAT superfamily N-acetyltransferase